MSQATIPGKPDVVLIGAGIMSATLGTMLKELDPSLTIAMLETLDDCAQESSKAWNNAGTGHAANCELNYTPQRPDGSVDISRATRGQCRVRPVAPALVLSGQEGSDRRSARVHPSVPAHELRVGQGECRIPAAHATRRCRLTIAITGWTTARTGSRSPTGHR